MKLTPEMVRELYGSALDAAVGEHLERNNEHPSRSMAETWRLAERYNREGFHKFQLDCRAGVWTACFSGMFRSGFCETPQEAILQALILDRISEI